MNKLVYVVISSYGKDYRVESVHETKEGAQKKCNEVNQTKVSVTFYEREVVL